MKKGLVSITFRSLSCAKITELCNAAGLRFVEWGGDVHVPAGDIEKAGAAAALCREAGVTPVGYGSYYNASDHVERFIPSILSAGALGSSYVRIWAGRGAVYDQCVEQNVAEAVRLASEKGIAVSLECHRNTMTENVENGVKLAKKTGCLLHFQPNPDVSFDENMRMLEAYAPFLCAVHVFAWEKAQKDNIKSADVRLALIDHIDEWRRYAEAAPDVPFLLEFVKDDSEEALLEDAKTLGMVGGAGR